MRLRMPRLLLVLSVALSELCGHVYIQALKLCIVSCTEKL
jgi:hypothetical protein